MRLISASGEQLGIVSIDQAMDIAGKEGLDLVKIASGSNPPVCKIMDYGKYRFEQSKKEKEQKKNQKVVETKEVQLSFGIQEHDLEVKVKRSIGFIKDGNKIKVSCRMFGRQQANPQFGIAVMEEFASRLSEIATVDKKPEVNGRNIFMVLVPKK